MDNLQRFLQFYKKGWNAFSNPQEDPLHISTYFAREQMKALVLYTTSVERSLPYRSLWHSFMVLIVSLVFSAMCYGLTESLGDLVNLGRDLAFIIGAFFIYFKLVYFHWYADGLDEVIDDLEACRHWLREGPGSAEARSVRHWHFLVMFLLLVVWSFFMGMFVILLDTSPLWVAQQSLPFHTIYPFEWHIKSKHPIAHALSYVTQVLVLSYILIWLLVIESLSLSIYFEITSAIKVLCIGLRHLPEKCHGDSKLLNREVIRLVGFHRKIISILDRTNEVFHGTLKMQVIVNLFLVTLSVFQALVARKDPKVALQFGVLMLLALGHLSMWSKFGDLVSHESLDIAQAAYEAYDPCSGCDRVNRDLCFIIQKAQYPMQMRASPFPAFNLINYSAILHQCYSILTLLLNTMD
ncbi:putative odorant receptor 65c [Drosophila serrata]|uniref:putative odorant receptor 65c n=1 Tax=Drosophila serrata TaxID=7274 RepID=UPI000A1CFF66|nr:putative odorant receptor 65c [Drosophila serrata]